MSEATTEKPATITITEAAQLLGISRASAYAAAHSGELPGVLRLGRRFVVSRRALERALDDEPRTA